MPNYRIDAEGIDIILKEGNPAPPIILEEAAITIEQVLEDNSPMIFVSHPDPIDIQKIIDYSTIRTRSQIEQQIRMLQTYSQTIVGLMNCRAKTSEMSEEQHRMNSFIVNEAIKLVRKHMEIDLDDIAINWKSVKREIMRS